MSRDFDRQRTKILEGCSGITSLPQLTRRHRPFNLGNLGRITIRTVRAAKPNHRLAETASRQTVRFVAGIATALDTRLARMPRVASPLALAHRDVCPARLPLEACGRVSVRGLKFNDGTGRFVWIAPQGRSLSAGSTSTAASATSPTLPPVASGWTGWGNRLTVNGELAT